MERLFKGYVPTKNKKCLIPFKNKKSDELLNYDQAKMLPEYAGILSDETILVDIDDYEQSELMMNIVEDKQLACKVYETSRGKHFLFKNTIVDTCKTHTKLACGLIADIKIGTRNSYEVLKYDNCERHVIYDIEKDEEYDEIPKYFLPIKTNQEFLSMEAGDGRNQALFNYVLTLQSEDFSTDDARETIAIINKYILKNPLSERELETILRDEAFQKPVFFKKNAFMFDKFALYLKNSKHVIKINNQLHIYKEGIYVSGSNEIESQMILEIPTLNHTKRMEVLKYLNILITKNTPMSDANKLAFKNGIYDIENDSFEEFSHEFVITNKIDWDFNPNAYNELMDKTLNKIACNDENIRKLLEEAIGYCLYRRNELRKAFILTGDKRNGKSTYLAIIKALLGDENTCSLDLSELGDRFKTAELFGKLANVGDDIGDDFISNAAVFKKLVSGDYVTVERKGQDPFEFKNYSKMLFSANNIPRIKDKTGAVLDRLVIIPFNARFSPDDPDFDPHIKYKLCQKEAIQYLINLGIEGLKRILQNNGFTTSSELQRELQEYAENNNPILLFFKDISEDDIVNNVTKEVFNKYKEFCIINNFNPMSNIEFSKQVKKHFDFDIADKKINGKKYRIFIRKE